MKKHRKYLPIAAIVLALFFGTYILHLHSRGITHLPIIRSVLEVVGFTRTPKCPKMPVIYDGVRMDPETFCEHYSRAAFIFVSNEDAIDKGVVYAFSSTKGMKAYLKSIQTK
jgi:hypothetical protein